MMRTLITVYGYGLRFLGSLVKMYNIGQSSILLCTMSTNRARTSGRSFGAADVRFVDERSSARLQLSRRNKLLCPVIE